MSAEETSSETFIEELRDVAPLVLSHFEEDYKPPRLQRRLEDWRCFGCGAHVISREEHLNFHRELSLRLFVLSACLKDLIS